MDKNEIQELMRKKSLAYCAIAFPCESPDGTDCNSYGTCSECDDSFLFRAGHATAADTLAECLSLAIADLEVIATREILITDLPTEVMWAVIRARSAIAAIESKLKGGDK